ncbi:MAG: hypothetical protein OXC12_14780 [Spirochaetaceae bacterium]|nr:hypothetical protein [Spirochaetaceae bacterium]
MATSPVTLVPAAPAAPGAHSIGELRERSLHAELKRWYAQPGDRAEVRLEGFVIDLVRGDTLIEIQTRGFAKLARKLTRLVRDHQVRLVFPIARRKWIVTSDADGTVLRRRASPKRGAYHDLYAELIRIPHLVGHANFTLEVLLVEVEELRCADGLGSWRRRGISIRDTRLLEVCDRRRFDTAADFARLLPPHLEQPFTNRTLAAAGAMPATLAGMMTYTLRRIGAIELVGRRNRAHLFARTPRT